MIGGFGRNTFIDRQRYWYEQGWSFSLIWRYTVAGSGGILNFVFDPTAFAGSMMEFNAVQFVAKGGPFDAEYYVGVVEDGDGTPQVIINRKSTSTITPASVIRTGATITNDGFNYFRTLVPGTQQSGADSSVGLPVEIIPSQKYVLRLINRSPQAEDITVDATFFEIP
jgi:hypothetical protein